jgi:ligand-binding sensor domain-containing protein
MKWIVLPRGDGLLILDDNGTPDYFGDDRSKKMAVTDQENKIISNAFSIAEDLEGNIWVGTDEGPVIYYNPSRIFDNDLRAYRIKIPRNDGSGLADYMLGTETITSIAVDGANRKWLGTASSGAYLLSPDGMQQLINYNESNSPLFSNIINSVAVDQKSGNVWFATSRGVLSVRGTATEGMNSFTGVYAFPNPVRDDFTGNVTIAGLVRDTQVAITDISGNLVYKTVSEGGQASWDLTTYNGKRVSTGVYVVFCASPDGSKSAVTKILVIN